MATGHPAGFWSLDTEERVDLLGWALARQEEDAMARGVTPLAPRDLIWLVNQYTAAQGGDGSANPRESAIRSAFAQHMGVPL